MRCLRCANNGPEQASAQCSTVLESLVRSSREQVQHCWGRCGLAGLCVACQAVLPGDSSTLLTPLSTACLQVQEEFSVGVMGEVSRARAAEKVAAGAKELGEKTASVMGRTASAVGQQVRTRLSSGMWACLLGCLLKPGWGAMGPVHWARNGWTEMPSTGAVGASQQGQGALMLRLSPACYGTAVVRGTNKALEPSSQQRRQISMV